MKRATMILLLGVAACAAPMSAETPNQRKAVARRVFEEIFNQGKFDVADQIYAKDFVNHGVTRDIGLKEDQAAARGWRSAFPDLRTQVDKAAAVGLIAGLPRPNSWHTLATWRSAVVMTPEHRLP